MENVEQVAEQSLLKAGGLLPMPALDQIDGWQQELPQAIHRRNFFLPVELDKFKNRLDELLVGQPEPSWYPVIDNYHLELTKIRNSQWFVRLSAKPILEKTACALGQIWQLRVDGQIRLRFLLLDQALSPAEISRYLHLGISELIDCRRIDEKPFSRKNSITIKPLSIGEKEERIPFMVNESRRVTRLEKIKPQGPNQRIAHLLEIDQTPIVYLATDFGGNWVELLQLYVSCWSSGLPGVFMIEPRANGLKSYFDRILGPSLKHLGINARLPKELQGVWFDEIATSRELFNQVGFRFDRSEASCLLQAPMSDFYIRVHQKLVDEFNRINGTSVRIQVVDLRLVMNLIWKNLTIQETLDVLSPYQVNNRVMVNYPNGKLRVNDLVRENTDQTWTEFFANRQAWSSGLLIHLFEGALAQFGPIYYNYKDSRLGKVCEVASACFPIFCRRPNGAHFVISGVSRCYSIFSDQKGGNNLDAFVLYNLLCDSDPAIRESMVKLIRAMTDRWIFPVTPETSGLIQVFTVGRHNDWWYQRYWEPTNGQCRP